MSSDKTIDVRVQTPTLTPFEVKIGRRTLHLDRIEIGGRHFRKVISQTPSEFWYTDELDKIRDTASGPRDLREFDVRRLPDICWQGLSDPLDALTDDEGDMMMQDMSELLAAQTAMHAVVIARTLSLGLDPFEWFSATPEERARRERLLDAPTAFEAPAATATRTEPRPETREEPEPEVKKAAPASPGGTLFFGNPADVKARRVVVFDFRQDGVTVRAFPQTKAALEEQFELTPRQIAAVRVAFRHVFKKPLDMPHPAAVPDPGAVRTANRVVSSIDEGALLLHLLWRVRQRSSWGFTSARGWSLIELGSESRMPATPRVAMRRMGRNELVRKIGEGRAALVGLTKEKVPA